MARITVTTRELRDLLAAVKGAQPATIVTETEPKMRKTGNPYVGRITKISTANVFINFVYANAVNNQQLREGKEANFVPAPRTWGERIPGTPLIGHAKNGIYREYLECRFLDSGAAVRYVLDKGGRGERAIEKDEFGEFVPERASSAEHQGVEKEIIIRDYDLGTIVLCRMRGNEYTVIR